MLRSLQMERQALAPLNILLKTARPIATAAMLFLTARAELPPGISPLSTALAGAALAAGIHPAAVVFGCLAGMLRLQISEISILNAAGCLLLLMMELVFSQFPKLRSMVCTRSRTAFFAGTACLLPAMIKAGGDSLQSLQAFACAALAAAAAPFMLPALQLSQIRKRLSPDEKYGCALIFIGCTAGFQRLFPPVAEFLSMQAMLLFPGFAPIPGILAGLGICLGGGGSAKLAAYALISLLTGQTLLKTHSIRAFGAAIAAILARFAVGAPGPDVRWALCAAAVYLLLPPSVIRFADEISTPHRSQPCDPERIAREAFEQTRRRLTALADAFDIMAEPTPQNTDLPDEQDLIQEMRSRLCTGCINYGACWAGESNRAAHLLCRLIGAALERTDAPPGMRILFSDGEVPPDIVRICRRGRLIPDRLGLLLRDFAQKRRSEIKRCENNRNLSVQLMQAGEILRSLAVQPPNKTDSSRLQAALEDAGLGFCDALPLPENAFALLKPEAWNRDEIRRACTALSRNLDLRLLPRPEGTALRLVRAPRLCADASASCQSGVAGEICGDSHLVRMLDERRLLLAVSDGMGTGAAAAAQSSEALRLLWSFLSAGISRQLALETVNRRLLMNSSEDIFATIDLCIIDLDSGVAEMTKLAACRTLLIRDGKTMRVEGGYLPLGILENVQGGTSRIRLRPDDVLVMGSDGVMEAGDILMIERLVHENIILPPDQLAEQLVRRAALSRTERHQDDLTCICAKISSAV